MHALLLFGFFFHSAEYKHRLSLGAELFDCNIACLAAERKRREEGRGREKLTARMYCLNLLSRLSSGPC